MTTDDTPYHLGASESERARLLTQAAIHRPEAESLLDRIGVSTGWRAIDIGCGPLGILDLLAERVGPEGVVVGLEPDPAMLDMARVSLAERGFGRLRLVAADAVSSRLPDESFDLVHERLVLANLPRPERIVAEMVRLARPGGVVALQDIDGLSWICEPPHPAWERVMEAVVAAWIGDPFLGRRLPGLLRDAGLVDVAIDVHIHVWRPGDPYHKLLLYFATLLRERILAGGSLGEATLDELLEQLDAHLGHPDTFTLYNTLFQAWGQKPVDRAE